MCFCCCYLPYKACACALKILTHPWKVSTLLLSIISFANFLCAIASALFVYLLWWTPQCGGSRSNPTLVLSAQSPSSAVASGTCCEGSPFVPAWSEIWHTMAAAGIAQFLMAISPALVVYHFNHKETSTRAVKVMRLGAVLFMWLSGVVTAFYIYSETGGSGGGGGEKVFDVLEHRLRWDYDHVSLVSSVARAATPSSSSSNSSATEVGVASCLVLYPSHTDEDVLRGETLFSHLETYMAALPMLLWGAVALLLAGTIVFLLCDCVFCHPDREKVVRQDVNPHRNTNRGNKQGRLTSSQRRRDARRFRMRDNSF